MGSKLFNLITGEQLKNWKNKIFLIGDIKIIGTESSHTLYNNGTGCNDAFRLMYKHWSGNVLEKDCTKYKTIETTEELINIMEYSRINNIFSFDYETSSLRYFDNEQVAHLMTITFQPGFSYIIIMEYPNHHHIEQCIENIKVLRPYFEDPTITKVGHNIKFDMHWNRKYSIGMRGRIADTMLMSFLNPSPHSPNANIRQVTTTMMTEAANKKGPLTASLMVFIVEVNGRFPPLPAKETLLVKSIPKK